ncbi:hypothetical protein SAMN05216359_105275 [Roseateles sp. YR242]|uniref:hypothetical protein n=1 Tax=Roseateles sp. YR242 TaxID=1855305 RepID=UPI0008D33DF5|nr:hypothetical protein [Roseateles sp. YR242]SEL12182.1 hypothetical protein SAMN05216359_105275 [Roseateles sp. YR242]
MSQEKHAIWYEPHPVSPERKAAIRSFGFRILDADFKPTDYENPDVPELQLAPELRSDGPTVAEFVAAGYLAIDYPPTGYTPVSTAEEVSQVIADQQAQVQQVPASDESALGQGADEAQQVELTATQIKDLLTAKGIAFKGNASRESLLELLNAAPNA